jgi:hypothetical protein
MIMDRNVKELAEKLLKTGYGDLPEREQRVLRRMAKRIVVSENVNEQFHEKLTFGQRLADQVPASPRHHISMRRASGGVSRRAIHSGPSASSTTMLQS